MGTPHNRAEKGDFAKTVLMPGDPLRAKYIAEHFLEEPRLVTDVRNMFGYTGRYKGEPVSVMGSGMGMPSIGIYSYELYTRYDVETIIRVGSSGSYIPDLHVYDIVLADGSYSESCFARVQSGDRHTIQYPDPDLNRKLTQTAKDLGIALRTGRIHSGDVFYAEPHMTNSGLRHHCICGEMESFALFHNAKVLGKKAACLLTISDSLVTKEAISPKEREQAFEDMMRIALETAIKL